jgi:midasin
MDDGEQKDNSNNDDLPEEMHLEGSDDGDEGPETPDEEDQTGEDDGIDPLDEDQDDPEDGGSSENDENDDEHNNQERTALSESCGDLPEQQQEVEEPKEDEDRSAVELPKAADDQTPAAYGIRSDKGKDSLLNGADEGDEHNTDDSDKQDGSNSDQRDPSAMKAHQPEGKGGRSQGESRDGQSHEVGGSNRDEQPVKPTSRELEPPNPFKNPGDVNEKWHRRLNLVLPPDGDGDREDAAESDGGRGDDDDQDIEDGLGKGLYEHASKEEGAMEQVLADAPEEDAVQLPEGGERSEDLPDSNPAAAAMGQDDEGPSDLQNERPDFDSDSERKRDRSQDEDRYTGQKAKKKRLNNNDSRADVGNEDRNEEISNDEDVNDDGAPMDEDNQSDTESRSADEAVVETREVNLSDSSKVVTKESFQFGPRSNVKEKGDEGVLDASEAAAEEIQCHDFDPREVSQSSLLRGRQLWQHYRQSTESYAMRLCEQLRLILEPTLATRLRGDYRTGKRINMRKVIPYVASGFRKDKIWLRRTKPAKRAYQVMVMIDDSSSMGSAGPLALSSLAMIATAMTRLEIGELSIASFAEDVTVLHKFGTPFTDECGASIVSRFQFEASRTMLSASLHAVKAVFDDARGSICQMSNLSSTAVLQLCFVISDARIDSDNREHLEAKVRALSEQNILVVLVIIDRSGDPKDSIFNTRSVSFVGNKVVTRSYFDDFPFPYYVAIQHIEALPDVLSNALKQWFELIHLQLSNH